MWMTYQNLDLWFTTWKRTLIQLEFGREATSADNVEGEVFFYANQMTQIVNLDETDGSLDNTTGNKGGRPPVVFSDPTISKGAMAANTAGYSSMVICGSSTSGEALPPHFQLKTLAKSDATMRISVDWFAHLARAVGKFGHPMPKASSKHTSPTPGTSLASLVKGPHHNNSRRLLLPAPDATRK